MRKLMIPILALGLVALLSSLFVIEEGERGIVLRFGRVLKDNNEIAKVDSNLNDAKGMTKELENRFGMLV